MRLEFRHECPSLEETMQFEHLLEGELQMDEEGREDLNANRVNSSTWLYVDGKLAGEQMLVPAVDFLPCGREPWDLPEINQLTESPDAPYCLYVYSTALLPEYQNLGLGRILCTYVLGYVRGLGFDKIICGHATSPAMVALRQELGATFGPSHEDWFGSGRIANFYVITL